MNEWLKIHRDRKGQWGKYPDLNLVRFVCRTLKDKEIKVLDLGCGMGSNIKFLHQEGFNKVIGIDISPNVVKSANKFLGKKCCFIDDIIKTKYLNECDKFDLIIDESSIQHLPRSEIKHCIDRSWLSLKEGGYLFSVLVNEDINLKENYQVVHFTKEKELDGLFEMFDEVQIDESSYTEFGGKNKHKSWVVIARK